MCASGENVSEVRVTETGFKGRVHLREEDYQPSLRNTNPEFETAATARPVFSGTFSVASAELIKTSVGRRTC